MQLIVFDPALCCSTGVCGPDLDSELVEFAADLKWLAEQGVNVRRHNLAQDPTAFATNSLVRQTLQEEGPACLPLGLLDATIIFRGSYPDRETLGRLLLSPAGER